MSLLQDLRFAVRLLIKDRWFTAVATIALALGIGMNATVFTFVNAVLIRGLPFEHPDRIVALGCTDARGRPQGVSQLDFRDWRDGARTLSSLAILSGANMNVSDEGQAVEQFAGTYNSASLFQLIGQRPMIGRDFTPDDDRIGAEPVVILGNGIWKNRYGSDPSIVGRSIKVNTLAAAVIGVMPPDMKFPNNNDLWMPFSQLAPELRDSKRNARQFQAIGRLADGVTFAQAQSELAAITARLTHDYPDTNKDIKSDVALYNDRVNGGPIRTVFLSLMGAVAFVLLIACANVANLLLARSAARSREIAVRVSLGASRWRIVRQLLVESVLLALVSGALGYGLAVIGVRWFDSVTQNVGKPYWMKFTMDAAVFAYFAAICLGTGIIFGLAPALHISKTDVNEVMKEGGGRSGTSGTRARRWTGVLIVVELMLTIVLLAGAGFMLRSFLALYRADLGGIQTSRLLLMRMNLPLARYPRREPRALLYQHLEERLRGVGAIQAFALATIAPLQGGLERQLSIGGRPAPAGAPPPTVTLVGVGSGYFDTLQLRLIRGRAFTDVDGSPGHEAAIVNQRFVAMHFPGEDPIGQRITLTDGSPRPVDPSMATLSATIVGIAPTIRQRNFSEPEPDPVVYVPYRVDPQRFAVLIVRGQGDAASLSAVVRTEMRALEPDLPLFNISTLEETLAQQRWPFRVFGTMFAIFAVVALVLSAVGLYAVTAYSVSQRTQEIGVRMALGAQARQVLWLVMRRSLVQLAIGLPIGIAGAFGVGKILESLLVQTSARDPITIGSIAALMIVVSIAACLWPARYATRLDPLSALRYE
jgi:putative ABC transport system permease protein